MSPRRLLFAVLAWLAIVPMAVACPFLPSITVENRHGIRVDELLVGAAGRSNPRGPVLFGENRAPQGGLAPGAGAVVVMPHCYGPFTLVVVLADGSRRTYPDLWPRPRMDLALR